MYILLLIIIFYTLCHFTLIINILVLCSISVPLDLNQEFHLFETNSIVV